MCENLWYTPSALTNFLLIELCSSGSASSRQLTADRYFRGKDPRDHFSSIESDPFCALATLLDPRFKKLAFSDPALADQAVSLLRAELVNISISQAGESLKEVPAPVVPDEEIDDWALALVADEKIVVRLHPEVPDTGEVDDYLTKPR